MTRRRMLQATGASILGMPVARLLAASGQTAAAKAEHVILFWNGGGMSHVDTWDPKPGRPVQGESSAIDTSADGIQISSIFPNLAKQMHHCALVRSIAGTNGAHGRATYELQTSYNMDPSLIHPGLGSIVVHEKNRLGDLPAFITINGQAAKFVASSPSDNSEYAVDENGSTSKTRVTFGAAPESGDVIQVRYIR